MSLLGQRRAGALAGLLVALVAYGAGARHLPELPSSFDVAFYALVVLPAFAAAIWLALPVAGLGTKPLLVLAVAAAVLAVALSLLDLESAANVAKLACYALVPLAVRGAVVADPRRRSRAVGRHLVGSGRPHRVRRGGAAGTLRAGRDRLPEPG